MWIKPLKPHKAPQKGLFGASEDMRKFLTYVGYFIMILGALAVIFFIF